MSAGTQIANLLDAGCGRAIHRAAEVLVATQHPDGYWWGDLTADSTLESDFILLSLWLHPPDADGAWASGQSRQNRQGSAVDPQPPVARWRFNIYQQGPSEVQREHQSLPRR